MIDLHCHILPYVDDGASNTEEALELLKLEVKQGVEAVCLTPHLRDHMFTTPDNQIWENYQKLYATVNENSIPIRLFLSREYYYDSNFREIVRSGKVFSLGKNRVVLVEFSYNIDFDTLMEAAQYISAEGYTPMFAHVERYAVVQHNPDHLQELIQQGVFVQINAADVLGGGGWRIKHLCKQLLERDLVHVIASDAHDLECRYPQLEQCYRYLTKKYGVVVAECLLQRNPLSILSK